MTTTENKTVSMDAAECVTILFAIEELAATYRDAGMPLPGDTAKIARRIMAEIPCLVPQFANAIFGPDHADAIRSDGR